MDLLLSYHRHLVEGWLLVMLLNLTIPYLLRGDPARSIFWTRIGYFAFWAFWSMVLFSGLIVFIFMKQPMTPPVIAMLILSLLLPVLDAYRAIRLKKLWLADRDGFSFSAKIVGTEILLVTALMFYVIR
ncbi:hypothetical protein [Nitratifractor sp.]